MKKCLILMLILCFATLPVLAENASAATVQAPQTVSAVPTLLASIFPILPFLMLIVSIVGGVM